MKVSNILNTLGKACLIKYIYSFASGKVILLHNLQKERLSINFDSATLLKESSYDWIFSCLSGKTHEHNLTKKLVLFKII